MSDSECELRRGRMANSDEQPSEPNRDHEGNLNSPSHFFIDFAEKVMACAPTARTIADDFHELPAYAKEKGLKVLVDEIMENLLKVLPKVEKEEFLDDCFKALYEKLPWKSQVSVANHVLAQLSPPSPPSSPSSASSASSSLVSSAAPPKARLLPPPLPKSPEPLPKSPEPLPKAPEPPGMFFVNIPDTIGSGNGQDKDVDVDRKG